MSVTSTVYCTLFTVVYTYVRRKVEHNYLQRRGVENYDNLSVVFYRFTPGPRDVENLANYSTPGRISHDVFDIGHPHS